MAQRDVQPLSWEVDEAEAKLALQRAQSWIARFSQLPIRVATETLVQTEGHTDAADARIAFSVVRTPLPSGRFRIDVSATCPNLFSQAAVVRSAHALAYYSASGIEYPVR
jgi:hypothetical protein